MVCVRNLVYSEISPKAHSHLQPNYRHNNLDLTLYGRKSPRVSFYTRPHKKQPSTKPTPHLPPVVPGPTTPLCLPIQLLGSSLLLRPTLTPLFVNRPAKSYHAVTTR